MVEYVNVNAGVLRSEEDIWITSGCELPYGAGNEPESSAGAVLALSF